jgi:hypothetical protein
MSKIQYIFIHHTAVSWKKNPKQWPATDAFHKAKGWGGGGYNYEVAADGEVHQFRKDGAVTAAQYQDNMNDGRAISICLDGNFDNEMPTDLQKIAVEKLLVEKMKLYNIPRENVFCHRKVAPKTCPGSNLPDDIYGYFVRQPSVISEWAKVSMEKALKKGIIKDQSNPQEILSPERHGQIWQNFGFKTKPGAPSLEEMAVILDRAGLL